MSDRKINNSKTKVFTSIIVTIITILILIGISIFWIKQNNYVKENLENENKISEENVIEEQIDLINEYGIFDEYYEKAEQKLETLTIEEKIAQLFVIGNSTNTDYTELQKYQFGGYLFFKEFFNEKTEQQVKNKIEQYQKALKIPLLMAVDEEGGIVVRISNNKNLSATPFKASSQIYNNGGFEAIKQDTINKSNFLNNLGINLNFAPVVDIANNPKDYMYSRSLQQDKDKTEILAKTVREASKDIGLSNT